jgi:hypothetical protein|uniref:Amine oxidase domain-containing protein n=1 Tax=viral metagenome TaxID=1070528 RepID=A0A6C0JFG5_9ZZZZ
MKVHIVGAGPTGMSLAWEILRSGDHEITIYDRKTSAGGSWWEPTEEIRDLHAHRIVFDKAFVNTKSLFNEMGINWDDIFEPVQENAYGYVLRSLSLKDYGTLTSLAARVLTKPRKYRGVSLKDALGPLSGDGQKIVEHLPLIMDGVTWDVMSAWEFVKSFDHVALSKQYTQKVSGKVMCDAMQQSLEDVGVEFEFGKELVNIDYMEDGYIANFSDRTKIGDGMLFLCLDNSPAYKLLSDNWGPDAEKKVRDSTYGAINILFDFDEPVELKTDLEIVANTKLKLQPVVLSDDKTISCVICNLTEDILTMPPEELRTLVLGELDVPLPREIRFGWGSEWDGKRWQFSQSSGVLSLYGQLPFFGECPNVAMCGMMSPRNTPYSSIEASVEVSRALSHKCFGTREPMNPLLLTQVVSVTILVLIVLILIYRNRNA